MKSGKITEDDFIKFQQFHRKLPASSIVFIFVLIIVMAIYYIFIVGREFLPYSILACIIPTIIFPVFIFLYVRYLLPNNWRKHYLQNKDLSLPFTMELGDDGLVITTELSKSKHPWNHFIKWKENSEMLLLYKADNIATILPKRIFDKQDIEFIHTKLKSLNILEYSNERKIPRWKTTSVFMLIVILCFMFYLLYSYYISNH